jgi:hypothetical protein
MISPIQGGRLCKMNDAGICQGSLYISVANTVCKETGLKFVLMGRVSFFQVLPYWRHL